MRPLTNEEKEIYERNLARKEEEQKDLQILIKHEELLLNEIHDFNCRQKKRVSQATLEDLRTQLTVTEATIKDCNDKITNGVEEKTQTEE